MDLNYSNNTYGQLATLDEDLPIEEVSLEEHSILRLIDTTSSEDSTSPPPPHAHHQKITLPELS